MRIFLVPFLLLLAACPDQSAQQCPSDTSLIGQYTLAFTGVHDAGTECIANTDAGPVKLTADTLSQRGATLCLRRDGGQAELTMLVAGKSGVYTDEIGADGRFQFTSPTVLSQATACSCDVNDVQVFDGVLVGGASDGGFALQDDGGLPPVVGISGTTVDTITASGSSPGCLCMLPCTVTYAVSGTRF